MPDHRNLSEEQRKQVLGGSRAERRTMKKVVNAMHARSMAVATTTFYGGAGLTADQSIREMANECNARNMSHGLTSMPMRFNVLEAFLNFRPADNAFEVHPECDHIFSLNDFLDFQTGPDAPSDLQDSLSQIKEGVIHSYNAIGDLEEMAFVDGDGNQFVVGAITFIRHADELSWMLVGGTIVDIEAESARLKERWAKLKPQMAASNTKHLDLDASPPAEAVALEGAPNAWRTLLLGRTTLNPMTHSVRYFCRDEGSAYDSYTDDPSIFNVSGIERLTTRQLDMLAHSETVLSKHSLVTEIAVTMFGLPAYFAFKVRFVVEQQRRTRLGDPAVMRDLGLALGRVAPADRITFRKVAALEILNIAASPAIRAYRPPLYQVEVEGFWRRLSTLDADGVDENGLPTKGRTWVRGHMRWRHQPPPPKVVLVKNSVAVARARAAALVAQASGASLVTAVIPEFGGIPEEILEEAAPAVPGWLYVMSSPMLEEGIYKIGWTSKTPAIRAEELSRQTGVPMAFVVVESWETASPKVAEQLVHLALAVNRINPRREFFKLPFASIRRTIEGVLGTR